MESNVIKIKEVVVIAVSLFSAAIFSDSLRFKFIDNPKTQVIFGALNDWASTFGAGGLFAHTGLFSQYVIGSAELVASGLLLIGLVPRLVRLNVLGALVAFAVMTGALSFHLFTPLGIDPNKDGGGLFGIAVALWIGAITLLILRRETLVGIVSDLGRLLVPTKVLAAR